MKKSCFILLCGLLIFLSGSQAFAKLGIGAGYLYQNMNEKTTASSISATNLNYHGFYVGVDYNANIGKVFAIVPGVYYEFLNCDSFGYGTSVQENYLKIPVDFQFGFNIGARSRFVVGLGPKLHVGLSSKIKGGLESIDFYQYMEELSGIKNAYGRVDVLLGVGLGLELFNHLRVNFGYDRGLVNRTAKIEGNKAYNNYIHVGISYVF